jgi:hypothetical protein
MVLLITMLDEQSGHTDGSRNHASICDLPLCTIGFARSRRPCTTRGGSRGWRLGPVIAQIDRVDGDGARAEGQCSRHAAMR